MGLADLYGSFVRSPDDYIRNMNLAAQAQSEFIAYQNLMNDPGYREREIGRLAEALSCMQRNSPVALRIRAMGGRAFSEDLGRRIADAKARLA